MVTFAILFLGLVLGPHEIELLVEGDVSTVRVVLDDRIIGELTGEPWRLECDFGPRLRPHNLQAIAFDGKGKEISRARQRINLPRRRAETAILLDGADPRNPDSVRLVWQHIEYQAAENIEFRFDGEKLVSDGDRARLPSFDKAMLHSLEASIRFPDGVTYETELSLGGQTMFGVDSEITGITVLGKNRDLPELRTLEGRFKSQDEPVRVVGVEKSPARVVMVVDKSALPALRTLGEFGSNLTNPYSALRQGEQLVFLFPEVKRVATKGIPSRLFSITQTFTTRDGGSIPWILTRVVSPDSEPSEFRRISDALAVAAVEAAQGNRPRAVVLILGVDSDDTSAYGVDEVRDFLSDLGVPLFVWWTGLPQRELTSESRRQLTQKTPWGRADDISSFSRFMQAFEKLRTELDLQMTVWIEGDYLPNEIEIAKGVREIKLAG